MVVAFCPLWRCSWATLPLLWKRSWEGCRQIFEQLLNVALILTRVWWRRKGKKWNLLIRHRKRSSSISIRWQVTLLRERLRKEKHIWENGWEHTKVEHLWHLLRLWAPLLTHRALQHHSWLHRAAMAPLPTAFPPPAGTFPPPGFGYGQGQGQTWPSASLQQEVNSSECPVGFWRWFEIVAKFGSVGTLNDWHVEIRLLVWISLGFARFGLEEKDRSVLIWSLFQVDTNLMFEMWTDLQTWLQWCWIVDNLRSFVFEGS